MDSNTWSTTRPSVGNAEKDVGSEEAGKLLAGSTVATKNHLILPLFFFQNYSQVHMETSKTCNMKVAQN
jgi:hypothetical protein